MATISIGSTKVITGQYIENSITYRFSTTPASNIKLSVFALDKYPNPTSYVLIKEFLNISSNTFSYTFNQTELSNAYAANTTRTKIPVKFGIYIETSESVWVEQNSGVISLDIMPAEPSFSQTPTYETSDQIIPLTNDNQMIVRGSSKLEITKLTGTAQKSATLKTIKVNDISFNYTDAINYNPSLYPNGYISINCWEQNIKPPLNVTLIDSRGFSKTVTIADISKFLYSYQKVKITDMSVERDGISETTTLRIDGYYSEGYQVGTNPIQAMYTYKENVSEAQTYTGATPLTITKRPSYKYQYFLDILAEYNNPNYILDSYTNQYYYEKATWDNGIDDLFDAAVLYNDKYTKEYLEADYDSTNERYYCISGGYNGDWKKFWEDSLNEIYLKMYGDNVYGIDVVGDEDGGNYSFSIETNIQGDIQTGFTLDKNFLVTGRIYGETVMGDFDVKSETLLSAIPAIDVVGNKLALHGIYDDEDGGDVQLNGDVIIVDPLSQNNVNASEDLKNRKNFIVACKNNNQTLSSANTETVYFINENLDSQGDRLIFHGADGTANSNSIEIGEGVHHIEVSAQVYITTHDANCNKIISVFKNSAQITGTLTYVTTNNVTISTTPVITSVNEGDIIRIILKSASGTGTVLGGGTNGINFLMVKVID